jgi:hypothetical protein
MANGAFKFKDNSGNVVSFISGSGSNISFSGGTLDLSGMTGLTLGNLTLSGTTQNALSASHAASYLLTSSFNTYSGTTDTVIGTLQTSTSSLNSFTSSATTRLNSIEGVSGSYATTGSNLFKGSQTISGSVIPAVTNTYDLGSPTNNFRHLYLSSASLYIDGTKVLGSTAQELQITTDTGQSFKILEAGSDNITLQSVDGNIELKSSGGGDVILDPTTGVIALKGTTTLYAGNKILSSDGNAIQIGNSATITGSLVVTGYIETQELRTTYISSSILYRSGSTKFGDELSDTHTFTGSLLVSGTISVPGSNLVSGSSQILNGSGVFSGSAQVDVMSTTNIARLATTGSNIFTGAITGTSATFSTGLAITGNGGVTNSANKFNLDFYGGNSRFYSLGTDASTKGGYEFHTNSSNGSLDVIALGISSTGAATFNSSVTATSFVKTTGTASQFLKADGSVDSSTYVTTDTTQTISGAKTFTTQLWIGSNAVIGGSNGQIQFDAATSSDLFISCIPGSRTVQIRNGNAGAPNYGACGLITGYATFVGLLTGQSSIYQSDAAGLIASNKWGTYNGGATAMTFSYNTSGNVIWTNSSDRMTLDYNGNLNVSSNVTAVRYYVSTGGNATDPMIRDSSYTSTGIYFPSANAMAITNGGAQSVLFQADGITKISNLRVSTTYTEYTKNLSGAYSSGTYYEIVNSSQMVSGIYIIKAYVDTYAIGGGTYFCTYASVPFFFYTGGSNNTGTMTFPSMLGSGHAGLNPPIIRLRLSGNNPGYTYLEFDPNANWSNVQGIGGATVTFYVKRIGD